MRLVATGLLAFMAVLFVVSRGYETRYGLMGFVRAFAEAVMHLPDFIS